MRVKAGRRFSEAALKGIASEILEVLDYLHSHQPPIIQPDIKPSNVLLNNDPLPDVLIDLADESAESIGQIYLVDFGSVQALKAIADAHGSRHLWLYATRTVWRSRGTGLHLSALARPCCIATGERPPTYQPNACASASRSESASPPTLSTGSAKIEPAPKRDFLLPKEPCSAENPTPPATRQ